jgi:MFS-type transporter involved in bile tolerance (Atg22 family)
MQLAEGALTSAITKDDEKTINGWAMYDWANSVYSLVITSSIFPIFFENNTTSEVELFGRTFKNTALFNCCYYFASTFWYCRLFWTEKAIHAVLLLLGWNSMCWPFLFRC